MKIRYLVGTAFLFALAAFVAPVGVDGQITIGLKGGANFAEVSDIQAGAVQSGETDFVGGAYAQFGFGGRWAIQPELLYSMRGSTLTSSGESATLAQTYVEVPVLLNVRLLSGIVEPQIYGGFSASFETKCEAGVSGEALASCDDVIAESATNSTLWAGVAGVAVDLDLGIFEFGVDGRYNYGFTKLLPDEPGFDEMTWRYFSVMAQVGIAIGR